MVQLAVMHQNGTGGASRDTARASELLREAARGGDQSARCMLQSSEPIGSSVSFYYQTECYQSLNPSREFTQADLTLFMHSAELLNDKSRVLYPLF
jgi:TPR repeat protein